MVVQDDDGTFGERSPEAERTRRVRTWIVLSTLLVAYLLLTLIMLLGMSLSKDSTLPIAGLLTWSLTIIAIDARWGQEWLGLLDYGTLFDAATGMLVLASMQGVFAISSAPFNATFGLSVLSLLPCLAIIGLAKRALFSIDEREALSQARGKR